MTRVRAKTKIIAISSAIFLGCAVASTWFLDRFLAPLFFNSYIERLGEKDLPKATIEPGNIVHCRMKADDFLFPLPPESRATNLVLTGGFDTVHGTVEVYFDDHRDRKLLNWDGRSGNYKLQIGGNISYKPIPGGLLIEFDYFGDK